MNESLVGGKQIIDCAAVAWQWRNSNSTIYSYFCEAQAKSMMRHTWPAITRCMQLLRYTICKCGCRSVQWLCMWGAVCREVVGPGTLLGPKGIWPRDSDVISKVGLELIAAKQRHRDIDEGRSNGFSPSKVWLRPPAMPCLCGVRSDVVRSCFRDLSPIYWPMLEACVLRPRYLAASAFWPFVLPHLG